MVQRLLNFGHTIIAYNRTAEKAKDLRTAGAEITTDADVAARAADIWIAMLSNYPALQNVLFSAPPDHYAGKTCIQMGTISPAESVLSKQQMTNSGGEYMEAPVLGSIPQVENGSLFILFGGSQAQFKQWDVLLSQFGDKRYYIGQVGQAAGIKLALNQLIASLTSAFAMSLSYVQELNIAVDQFMEILKASALYAPTFDKKLTRMLHAEFSQPNFPVKHLLKDVRLIVEEFQSAGIGCEPMLGVAEILHRAINLGYGDLDYSALYSAIRPPK